MPNLPQRLSLWPLTDEETVVLGWYTSLFVTYALSQTVLVPWIERVTR